MDSNFNLYAFGLNGKDYNAGVQSKWTSSTPAKDITKTGRPPFNGPNPKCYLAQYQDSVYVLGADTANPASVYIFDYEASSWSRQAVNTNGFNPASYEAILDHDTNVFYAISGGNLWDLNLGEQVKAKSTALTWHNAGAVPYGASYNPVMAIANNHISFFDVPNVPAGSTDLYVIHYAYWQPKSQAYPLAPNGGNFPAEHGQVTSFYQSDIYNVQQEIAYIPDDGSATYVVNVLTNTTRKLAAPSINDSNARYFAGATSLVQLASNGSINFLPYHEGWHTFNLAAKWTPVKALSAAAKPTSAVTHAKRSEATSASTSESSVNQAGSLHKISGSLSALLALSAVLCLL